MSNLYVVGTSGHPYVKVGMTNRCVEKRIGDWDTGSAYDWTIHFDLQIDGDLAGVEGTVHSNLHKHHVRGEWFNADPLTVLTAVWFALDVREATAVKLHRASPTYELVWEHVNREEKDNAEPV